MPGLFDGLEAKMGVAYTLVAEGMSCDDPMKGKGGWAFATPEDADTGRAYLPEFAPDTEVRALELPEPLGEVAHPHPDIDGLWILDRAVPIRTNRTDKPQKKAKKKRRLRKGKRR